MRTRIGHTLAAAPLLCAALLMAGCSSVPEETRSPEERVEFLRGEVEELLENGEPEQALQDTLHYGSIEVFGIDTVNSYYIRAVEQLASQLRQSSEQEHYDAALRRYDSLARLVEDARAVFPALEELAADAGALPGAETLDQYARDELQARQAVSLLESGNDALALTALTALESWEHLETAQLERFSEAALSQQNRFALERLERVLESRGGTMPEEAAALLERQPSPNEMVPGTVTVWVDQGIRIQQGAGVPDRVIGSGFFIDKRGYLLTNYHIVRSQVDPEYEGYSRLYVRLPGNPDQRVPAQVVGYDRIFDVALLKTPIEPDYTFSFTQIRELDPGTSILTIGSPGGLQSSISSGIISATDRRFLQIGEVLQVDLPVNPGNSGGPVFDQSGRLVGVVFAGIEQFEGVNFAIPSYWVRPLLSRLYEEGEVRHPWLGVSVAERSGSLEVTYVSRGSPADEVGLEVGDHIQSVNGTDVSRIPQAQDLLLRSGVNQLMSLRIRRDGEQRKTMVALAERPHRPVLKAIEAEQISEVFAPLFGMTTNEVGRFPWQQEFVVTDVYPGTIADETGLSENDPFSLLDWRYNEERRAVGIEIVVRKRKAGFLETAVQLAAPVETNNFL